MPQVFVLIGKEERPHYRHICSLADMGLGRAVWVQWFLGDRIHNTCGIIRNQMSQQLLDPPRDLELKASGSGGVDQTTTF